MGGLMKTLTWLTDVHLNFLSKDEQQRFYKRIKDENPDGVLITGDIAEATNISDILLGMANVVNRPIYFILGNHDYYHGSVHAVRNKMLEFTDSNNLLNWLPQSGPQRLNENTVLVGQDGWADGRLGNYRDTPVMLNDSRLIEELFKEAILGRYPLLDKMQSLADDDANALKANIKDALKLKPKKILIATHVPPFKEACLYEGKISGDDFLPFFGAKVMGDVVSEFATQYQDISFVVFCGHTHHQAHYQPMDNLIVKVGAAEYYYPEIQEVVQL